MLEQLGNSIMVENLFQKNNMVHPSTFWFRKKVWKRYKTWHEVIWYQQNDSLLVDAQTLQTFVAFLRGRQSPDEQEVILAAQDHEIGGREDGIARNTLNRHL